MEEMENHMNFYVYVCVCLKRVGIGGRVEIMLGKDWIWYARSISGMLHLLSMYMIFGHMQFNNKGMHFALHKFVLL